MQPVVEYEYLLPYQFAARIEAHPLVYVPVGSLEWHGEHMALGNDAIKMHALCCEAACLGGGIVFPPVYYGIPYMVGYGQQYTHDANLPLVLPGGIHHLLYPGDVGGKGGHSDAPLRPGKDAVKGLAYDLFRRGLAIRFRIGGIGEKHVDPPSPNSASLAKSVNRPSTGVWSNLKSPEWTTKPTGVVIPNPTPSGME